MSKIWSIQRSSAISEEIREQLGIPDVVAEILIQRGLNSSEAVIDFLRPSLLNLSSPFAFVHMPKAIERLKKARILGEKVLVYGDYDVDGVTSTALLYKTLIDLNFNAVTYIPHRQEEGYGLHREIVEKAANAQVKVIITVDCGISAIEEIKLANDLGIDVIVTDHHEPLEHLPEALAIINPKLPESGYPFSHLAGVGVAFKLVQALLQEFGDASYGVQNQQDFLDLVALGTIADIVPLIGENRIIVAAGLAQMEKTKHVGLEALLKECGLYGKPLTAGQIGFILAPRINAAGRMDTARIGLELLLTEDEERAAELSRQLSRENALRQQIEQDILDEAIAKIEQDSLPRVIVLSGSGWHHGVIGIVASRLVERYYRPVFLIAEEGEESKGSARGIQGYHVLEQLTGQKDLLLKFGGHRQAAGFSLRTENIPLLREGLNQAVADWPEEIFRERLIIDQQIELDQISPLLLDYLEQLAPFGFGNPNPVFAGFGYNVHSMAAIGKDQSHLKINFGKYGEKKGIAFRKGEMLSELINHQCLDVAFTLEWNHFQGNSEIQLLIKDIRSHALSREGTLYEQEELLKTMMSYAEVGATKQEEKGIKWLDWRKKENLPDDLPEGSVGVIKEWPLSQAELRMKVREFLASQIDLIALAGQRDNDLHLQRRCLYFNREQLAGAYRYLQGQVKGNTLIWDKGSVPSLPGINGSDWLEIFKIFEELGLIECIGKSEILAFRWNRVEKKLDLEQSLRYRAARKRFEEAKKFQRVLETIPIELMNTLL